MKMQQTSICPACDGTGWRPVERGGVRAVEVCSCRRQPHDAQWWMDRAQIPPRFRDCDFEHFDNPHKNYTLDTALMTARKFAEQYPLPEKGILFIGNPGVGKTHLTVAVLKRLMMEKNVECLFCSFPDLLEKLQESYDPVSQLSKAEILTPILETEVVAIDDLGARRISDWVEDTVTYILNTRYNQKKPTLLTTNVPDDSTDLDTPSQLRQRIGYRVYSRLYEMCERVSIQAVDFRQDVSQHNRRFV